jgi:uncharacterized membrane protein YoaT (DUF817 family)
VTFAVSFSVIRDEVILAGFLAALLLSAAAFFRNKQDWKSVILFTVTGVLIESTGLWKGFWRYPHARYFELPLWGPLMWANIGMIVSRLAPPMSEAISKLGIYKNIGSKTRQNKP